MTNSGFVALDDVGEGLAEGYGEDSDGKLVKNIYLTTPEAGADGGVVSTAPDICAFLYSLRSGQLLSEGMTKRMLTPVVPWSGGEVGFGGYVWYYGHGLMFNLDADGKLVRYGHTGEEFGVSGRVYHYPEADLDLVVLSNVSEGSGDLTWDIHGVLIGKR